MIDRRGAMSEFVFLNLRLRAGFALDDFERRFGASFVASFGETVERLIAGGLLVKQCERISLTERGVELGDSVFAEFV